MIYLDAQRTRCGRITINHFSLAVHQELGEVPFDAVTKKPSFARFQKLVQRIRIFPINVNLNHINQT